MELLYDYTLKKQQKEIEEQCKEIEEQRELSAGLIGQMEELRSMLRGQQIVPAGAQKPAEAVPVQVVGQAIGTQNNITNNTVNVVVFGQEKLDHITSDDVRGLLDQSIRTIRDPEQSALAALLGATRMIYSNPEHPENITCYLPNKKQDMALVHVERGGVRTWEVKSCKEVLPPMATRGCDVIFAKQPFTNIAYYEPLMLALRDGEDVFKKDKSLRAILEGNKQLMLRLHGTLPH